MAELKTKPNDDNVDGFINSVENEQRKGDAQRLLQIMREVTGEEPKMWGTSIIGYGTYHYVYPAGNEGDWMLAGFSPRKQALTIYVMSGFDPHKALMEKLGKFKTGKGCLYVKRLSDIDEPTLRRLISDSIEVVKKRYSG